MQLLQKRINQYPFKIQPMSEYNPAEDMERQLKWNEHIRKRPGMYVGIMNVRGFMDLLKGAISETTVVTNTDLLSLELNSDLQVKIGFNNHNGTIQNIWSHWEESSLNTSLVEILTLNALSQEFEIRFYDNASGSIAVQRFEAAELIEGKKAPVIDFSRCEIDFVLDKNIWGEGFAWNTAYISHELREYAYLFKDVRFDLSCVVKQEKYKFDYWFQEGLKDRINVETLNGLGGSYFETQVEEKIGDFTLEAAFAFREYSVDSPFLKSYVNNYLTTENGSHVDGLLKGLTYGVMKYFQKHNLVNDYKISEKGMKESLIAILNIKLDSPVFSGCVKNKLANSEIIEPIANHVSEVLFKTLEADEKNRNRLIRRFEI